MDNKTIFKTGAGNMKEIDAEMFTIRCARGGSEGDRVGEEQMERAMPVALRAVLNLTRRAQFEINFKMNSPL